MEDSFRVRVDKVFGSLSSSSSSSASLSSLWSLTDDEIHPNNRWNRDKEDDPQLSDMDFRSQMENDLSNADEENNSPSSSNPKPKPPDYNDEEWEIKNSIGFDSTLDLEEEEDEYDKVAVENENVESMGDAVDDYGINIDSSNELPTSFKDVIRDPRANHAAAKIRLKEDAETAKKMDSLRVSDKDSSLAVDDIPSTTPALKSILKKRDDDDDESESKSNGNALETKSNKRVRFDPECKEEDGGGTGAWMETDSREEEEKYKAALDYHSGIPDYMRNPSKYTRYTFDSSSDVDEQSNRQAYMDFLTMVKASKTGGEQEEDDALVELPKSVTFIPKKKAASGDITMVDTDAMQEEPLMVRRDVSVSIAAALAGDAEDIESSAIEENEQETAPNRRTSLQKSNRRYRNKAKVETDDAM